MGFNFKKITEKIKNLKNTKSEHELDYTALPEHIGFIMDGNGRWAARRGLPRSAGHKAGAEALRRITEFCDKIGIKIITVYAFSTENWKRPQKEVKALMGLLSQYLGDAERELAGKNIVIKVIGDITTLSQKIQQQVIETERLTQNNTGLLLNIAINYGGRDEIIHAVKQIAKEVQADRIAVEDIDDQLMSQHMYTRGIKDPDLIIRPSGELRLSNFLLWQSAYSEFWFAKIYWPDFNSQHLLAAISDYQKRTRRFGGI